MHQEIKERIERLRAKASEAETALSKLKAQLAQNHDLWVNAQLTLASNWLNDVEAFFIHPLEKGDVAQEAYWLSHAEHHFEKVVIPQIKGIQDAVAKHGPNLRTFST